MDTAMDLSLQRIVQASEAHSVPSGIRKYLCPSCFQKVHYRNGGSYKPHFAHMARDDFTIWCERRVDSHGSGKTVNPLLIKSPFPIYLFRDRDYYELQVHFRPIPECYSNLSDYLIKIGRDSFNFSYKISNFIGKYHSIVLTYLPRYDSNIIGCSNSNVITMLNQWGRFIDFFEKEGALFKERDGRKIRVGGAVYCGSSYYYMSIDGKPPKIESKRCGDIKIGSIRFPVYLIVFPEEPTSELTTLCDALHVYLLEQRAEPRVLWPPLVLGEGNEMRRLWKDSQICLSLRSSNYREIWEEGKTIQGTHHFDEGSLLFFNSKENDVGYNIIQSDAGDYLHFNVFDSIDAINQNSYTYDIEPDPNNKTIVLKTNFKGCVRFINKYNELFVKSIGSTLSVHCPDSIIKIYLFNKQNTLVGLMDLLDRENDLDNEVLHRVDIISGIKVRKPSNFRKEIRHLSAKDPVLARMLVAGSKDDCVSDSVVRYLDRG